MTATAPRIPPDRPRTAASTAPHPNRRFFGHALPAGLILLMLLLTACGNDIPVSTSRFAACGETLDLSLVGVSRERAREAKKVIQRDLDLLWLDLHPWRPDAALARVNDLLRTGEPFVAPPSIMPLIRLGKLYETRSGGLVNLATGDLMALWGFHEDRPRSRPPPAAGQIARLLEARPSLADIEIDGLELRGRNAMLRLDFSAIARGYALDIAAEHLRDLGIESALIQSGGDLRAMGDRRGQPWRIAIHRPGGAGVLAMLPTRGDESLATLTEDDRDFVFKSEHYHAILDPRTGRPARGTRMVTVLHTDAATARAAAAAIFVAGPDDWHGVAAALGIGHVLLVDAAGNIQASPAMAARLEPIDESVRIRPSAPPPADATPAAAPPGTP